MVRPENLLAVNTLTATDRLTPLDFSALANASHDFYRKTEPQDLRGPILLAALGLLLLDTLLVLYLGGGIGRLIPRISRATAVTVLILSALALSVPHARANDLPNGDVPRAALETKLAYVVTGNRDVDFDQQGGTWRTDAVSRSAHRAGGGRARRPRHLPR